MDEKRGIMMWTLKGQMDKRGNYDVKRWMQKGHYDVEKRVGIMM